MNRKKRIALVNEASSLRSGFGKMGYEILSRLYATNKYEIFELGNYVKTSDPRNSQVPWLIEGSVPEDHDQIGQQIYNSSMTSQFGSNIFENFILRHQIDIVISWTDHWMLEFQARSPFRKYIKLLWMACIDSKPQQPQWIEDYKKADYLTVYSKFGKDVLEDESGGEIKINELIRPGVNHEIFKPLDKKAIRNKFEIPINANIIGFIGRSQPRKLHAQLIEDFTKLLKFSIENNNETIANNTYLYLHTSWPDVGWDFTKYIIKNGIGHRVLFTYSCQNCRAYYPSFISSELTPCKFCNQMSAHFPNTSNYVSEEALAEINNLFDLYVQYSICEGLGMPQIEAKACGVPSCGTDYSATAEQLTSQGGSFPIKVKHMFWESDYTMTGQSRAYPDKDDFIKKVYSFLNLPQATKDKMGELARKDAVENYSFDRATKLMEEIIDKIEISETPLWVTKETNFAPNKHDVPQLRNNTELLDWGIENILGKPELKSSLWKHDLLKALNTGIYINRGGKEQMNGQRALSIMHEIADKQNFWEQCRLDTFFPQPPKPTQWEII